MIERLYIENERVRETWFCLFVHNVAKKKEKLGKRRRIHFHPSSSLRPAGDTPVSHPLFSCYSCSSHQLLFPCFHPFPPTHRIRIECRREQNNKQQKKKENWTSFAWVLLSLSSTLYIVRLRREIWWWSLPSNNWLYIFNQVLSFFLSFFGFFFLSFCLSVLVHVSSSMYKYHTTYFSLVSLLAFMWFFFLRKTKKNTVLPECSHTSQCR